MKNDMGNIRIIRSGRKTLGLQITKDGEVVVRSPMRCPEKEIRKLLSENSLWIEKHIKQAKERAKGAENVPIFTAAELKAMSKEAIAVLPERASYYAPALGVQYGRITIRSQRTRWGSCSAKGNLNFNCLLTLVPPEIMDYVVVHELCHLKELNHSDRFWAAVAEILPDYKERRKWLKDNGASLIERLP